MITHVSSEVPAPFEAYSGDGPSIFISYAHADKVVVFDAIRQLHEKGANIWYDEGIQAAGEWVEEIAHAIKDSVLFLVFISPRSIDSRYVRQEIGYASSLNKEILTLFVEDTSLPAGLSLILQQFQSLALTDETWKPKALKAIFDRMENSSFDDQDSRAVTESEEVDHGEILWRSWEKARGQQIKRYEARHGSLESISSPKKVDVTVAQPSKALPENKLTEKPTRYPSATHVEVAQPETQIEQDQENFQDPTIGTLSWITHGEISISVPYSDEEKVVHVKHGFWMSQLLITQEIYEMVMGFNPSFFDVDNMKNEEHLPVNNVSWLDAVSFCKALTILSEHAGTLPPKYEFRLPTEVEWEYACRAGSLTKYYFGDNPHELQEHAWFRGNSLKRPHPVGKKRANPWGLFDLYGNVREWVGDSFVNTLLNDSGQDEFRISRGGAYMKPAEECQSSSRSTNSLNHRFRNLGFRPVLARVFR
jgi:formylglycine-generating enzyme required for sulfatase activity